MIAVKAMLNNNRVLNESTLNALKFLVDFMLTHALSGRTENKRNEMTSFNFLRSLKHIGPNGMKSTCNMLNKGKLLKNGTLKHSICVTHKNRHFSLDADKRLVLFYRFNAMGEPFPGIISFYFCS